MPCSNIQLNGPPSLRTFLERLPPLSPTLTPLLATLSREDASYARIAELIEKDPVLAGNVLGLVNSSLYGRRGRVSSVGYAVSLLGLDKLRNVALGMSIMRMWNRLSSPLSWSMRNFNRHALAVAMLSDLLAQEAPVNFPEGAFVAGLLHDLGKLMIAACLPSSYEAIERLVASTGRPENQCETDILGTTHAEISGEAMQVWSLPPEIEAAVRYHHRPEPDAGTGAGLRHSLSLVIATADQYVNQLGWGAVGYSQPARVGNPYPIETLGIDNAQRVLEAFHGEFDSVSAFF